MKYSAAVEQKVLYYLPDTIPSYKSTVVQVQPSQLDHSKDFDTRLGLSAIVMVHYRHYPTVTLSYNPDFV